MPSKYDGGVYWLLLYEYVDGILERRRPFREAHLALARDAQAKGVLLHAGAVGDPVDSALFVFKSGDDQVVREFVEDDPYVREGLVTGWTIRPWNVVIGAPA